MAHITFIHGMGPQPDSGDLLRSWQRALAQDGGIDLGREDVSVSMVYWADVFHDLQRALGPLPATREELERSRALWRGSLDDDGRLLVEALEGELLTQRAELAAELLDWDWITDTVMELFFGEVNGYLRNVNGAQEQIRARVVKALRDERASTGHVLVAHSMGSVIAYDCLKRVHDCPGVGALVSFGSPLGWSAIQELLEPDYSQHDGYPDHTVRDGWSNVFDRLDFVVAGNWELAEDFKRGGQAVIYDRDQQNDEPLGSRHDAVAYLRGAALRGSIREALAATGGA
jgi:hypothetical protein